MAGISLKTAPSTEPIDSTEAKLHLRESGTDQDDLITSLIIAAREYVENWTRRALVTQTWTLSLDGFPESIEIPKPPLSSVTSIKYTDENGTEQTFSSSKYVVDTYAKPFAKIDLAYLESWPVTRDIPNSVRVEFVAGYGAATAIPSSIKAAMKLIIGNLYENREATISGTIIAEVPMAVDALLWPYRVSDV